MFLVGLSPSRQKGLNYQRTNIEIEITRILLSFVNQRKFGFVVPELLFDLTSQIKSIRLSLIPLFYKNATLFILVLAFYSDSQVS